VESGAALTTWCFMSPETRLATYGTLAPGKPNHHHLSDLPGRWVKGFVKGALVQCGWGAALGFPALIFDDTGSQVSVDLFESDDLPNHWPRLDALRAKAIAGSKCRFRPRAGNGLRISTSQPTSTRATESPLWVESGRYQNGNLRAVLDLPIRVEATKSAIRELGKVCPVTS
jgi:gamma-glutamylcyclotransferase (GGCT)/AIG2-like uncharacterized protein YtfP